LKVNTLFLTLRTFSATGGIEKVCKVAGKALYEQSIYTNIHTKVYSMYDHGADADGNDYFPAEMFTGFAKKKLSFILSAVLLGRKNSIVLLSHVNLLLVGWLIKLISPTTKLVLMVHGIEVWSRLKWHQRIMLRSCNRILSVSHFTADKMVAIQGVKPSMIHVLNNCLDPFLQQRKENYNKNEFRKIYQFAPEDQVLFTLTRLSSKERYKGYDQVIQCIGRLSNQHPHIKYLIAGRYDADEKEYLDRLIQQNGIAERVVFTGFIPDEDLVAHFMMSDLYVMPSRKEGFGIVFIEAMYYGLPVIAGNKDGSVDALLNGALGKLVDPASIEEIEQSIDQVLNDKAKYAPNLELLMNSFGYDEYKRRLEEALKV
jgi:glycosyltransferase involved in cell wall biosynthesis